MTKSQPYVDPAHIALEQPEYVCTRRRCWQTNAFCIWHLAYVPINWTMSRIFHRELFFHQKNTITPLKSKTVSNEILMSWDIDIQNWFWGVACCSESAFFHLRDCVSRFSCIVFPTRVYKGEYINLVLSVDKGAATVALAGVLA
jgi:hypothetical protein